VGRQRERGRSVPPEYLQRVIAEHQGLDLSVPPDGDDDKASAERDEAEELEEAQRRYWPRTLGTNADRYREFEEGVLAQEDEELASTYIFVVDSPDVNTKLFLSPTPNVHTHSNAHQRRLRGYWRRCG